MAHIQGDDSRVGRCLEGIWNRFQIDDFEFRHIDSARYLVIEYRASLSVDWNESRVRDETECQNEQFFGIAVPVQLLEKLLCCLDPIQPVDLNVPVETSASNIGAYER